MAEGGSRQTYENEDILDFFENAALSLHWVGPDGMILKANQYELDFLGYEREQYEGHHIAEFHADPDVIEDILARLGRAETLQDYEARMIAADGSIKHVLINSNVRWNDGEFVHTRCFTRDITASKEAEEDMRASAVQLNDRVIQDIVVAKMTLEIGESERALSPLESALASARSIMTHLLKGSKSVAEAALRRAGDPPA